MNPTPTPADDESWLEAMAQDHDHGQQWWPPGTMREYHQEQAARYRSILARLRQPAPQDVGEALSSVASWLDRWAQHVGNCKGYDQCTCGLTAIRAEAEEALAAAPQPGRTSEGGTV